MFWIYSNIELKRKLGETSAAWIKIFRNMKALF